MLFSKKTFYSKLLLILNQILVHFVQKDVEKQRNMLLIRQFLDAPLKRGSDNKCESKKPILNHAVDMDRVPSLFDVN